MTTKTKTILDAQWVVAEAEPIERFTSAHYPELCQTCRSAIDSGWQMLIECELWDGVFYCDDDPEAGFTYAYDQGWLCGGRECACRQEQEDDDEPETEFICWLVSTATRYAAGWEVLEEVTNVLTDGDYYDLRELLVKVGQHLDKRASVDYGGITAVIDHGETWTEINIDIRFGSREQYEREKSNET